MFKLEISTYNIEGVKEALRLGADRVELCDNIKEGGTTPSFGLIRSALDTGHPSVFIIVRPRGGDFLYSDDEYQIIRKDIIAAREMGVHGVVCGLLNKDGSIDTERTKALIELARPMRFTFHRAFDMCNNHKKALEDLISIGVDIVLTSGMENTATEGSATLKELVTQASGRINILVGSGVNANNIEQLFQATGAHQYHMSAVKEVKSEMKFFNRRLCMGNEPGDEYKKLTVDNEKIINALKVINQLKKQESNT